MLLRAVFHRGGKSQRNQNEAQWLCWHQFCGQCCKGWAGLGCAVLCCAVLCCAVLHAVVICSGPLWSVSVTTSGTILWYKKSLQICCRQVML